MTEVITEESKPTIENGIIYYPDGSRETEKKKLRLIQLSKINFSDDEKLNIRIDDKLEYEIREIFELFTDQGGYANPSDIVEGLRSVSYNRKNPEVFRIIEDFSHQYEKKQVTFPMFINNLNERLGKIRSWNSCGKVFNNIIDKDLFNNEGKTEITEQSLQKVLEHLGEKLTIDDVKYIMNFVADGKDPNIVQDEFYYLMTKKPIEYHALAGITKSFK
jgi:Ca2+-binding EF-hand superfamily protein